MARLRRQRASPDRRHRALNDTCPERDCPFCVLGARLLDLLSAAEADPGTEMLTLVRVLAATIVASCSHPLDQATLIELLVGQLHEDVALFSGVASEIH